MEMIFAETSIWDFTITHACLAITNFCEVKCNQVAVACLIQCIHNAAIGFSISWTSFLETQTLPINSNSIGYNRVFHWRKLRLVEKNHHRNATKFQIWSNLHRFACFLVGKTNTRHLRHSCKSKVAVVAMCHGRTNLVEVGIFFAWCTWEEHKHHKTFMSKMPVYPPWN